MADTITIRLKPEVTARLDKTATSQGLTRSELVRRLIEAALPAPLPVATARRHEDVATPNLKGAKP